MNVALVDTKLEVCKSDVINRGFTCFHINPKI